MTINTSKMTMAAWTPELLASEALVDCAKMLGVLDVADAEHERQWATRKALRAAHDAMHCSLVVLFAGAMGQAAYPYSRREEFKRFVGDEANLGREIPRDQATRLFHVESTKNLIKVASRELAMPFDAKELDDLIAIRNDVEHPKPGITGWSISICRQRSGQERVWQVGRFGSQVLATTASYSITSSKRSGDF